MLKPGPDFILKITDSVRTQNRSLFFPAPGFERDGDRDELKKSAIRFENKNRVFPGR
jgi:hypothetical protein